MAKKAKKKSGKGITAKQRAARKRNMAVARAKRWNKAARKKQSRKMVDRAMDASFYAA